MDDTVEKTEPSGEPHIPAQPDQSKKFFNAGSVEAVLYDAWNEALMGNTEEAEALCEVARTGAEIYIPSPEARPWD